MTANTDINGMEVRYRTTGNGADIVLLHGWGCDLEIWNALHTHLENGFRVTALDFPGFGKSDEPPFAWSVGDYTDWLELFFRDRGISDPILVGHSFGGRVSLVYASRNPVCKMVLVDSAGVKPRRSPKYYMKVYSFKALKRLAPVILGRKRAERMIEERRRQSASSDYSVATPVMRATLSRVVNEDLRRFMPLITAPTLLVWGSGDTATPVRDARVMEKLIKGSGLVVFDGAGHYSFLDRPAQFAAVMDSFLQNERQK